MGEAIGAVRSRMSTIRMNTSVSLLDIVEHPNKSGVFPNQKVLVVSFDGYVYLVPFVEEADHFFLKTVIPSRKATRGPSAAR